MYIYNITLVPANMAVNGVLRVRRWNWCVESLHEGGGKKGSAGMNGDPAFSLGVPKQAPLLGGAPMPHIICRETVYVCACVSIGSDDRRPVKCLRTDSQTRRDPP